MRDGGPAPAGGNFPAFRRLWRMAAAASPFRALFVWSVCRRIPHRPGESLDRMEKARYNMYVRLKRECFARSLAVIHKLTQGFFLLPAPPYWRAVFEKAARVARCFLRAVCCMGISGRVRHAWEAPDAFTRMPPYARKSGFYEAGPRLSAERAGTRTYGRIWQ